MTTATMGKIEEVTMITTIMMITTGDNKESIVDMRLKCKFMVSRGKFVYVFVFLPLFNVSYKWKNSC